MLEKSHTGFIPLVARSVTWARFRFNSCSETVKRPRPQSKERLAVFSFIASRPSFYKTF
jgi:hypothetical protein